MAFAFVFTFSLRGEVGGRHSSTFLELLMLILVLHTPQHLGEFLLAQHPFPQVVVLGLLDARWLKRAVFRETPPARPQRRPVSRIPSRRFPAPIFAAATFRTVIRRLDPPPVQAGAPFAGRRVRGEVAFGCHGVLPGWGDGL